MQMDKRNCFNDGTDITGGTTVYSDILDMGAAMNLGEQRKLSVLIHLASKSGTTPDFTADLEAANEEAFDTTNITVALGPVLTDVIAVPSLHRIAIPQHARRRYFRLKYTLGNADNHFAVTAAIVEAQQTTGLFGALP